jgi:DNA (cytosine-5)-methyltransferase 1
MRYATLCSGIGAPEVAFGRLGWECVFQAEIEPFACAVLAHHWPSVPNYGDMTLWREWPSHDLDLLVAGTPCQAFSVAGLRGSLDDARGNLTLEFARYANHVRPRTILWENVPGVLNTKDNAFGCFLGALAGADCELRPNGKRWTDAGLVSGRLRQIAWRVLDAQYRGLAQRRRRVFVLACDVERGIGDWACARALFPQSEGVCGDYPAGGEAWQDIAGALGGGSGGRGWCDDFDRSGAFIAGTLTSKAAKGVGGPSGCECQNLVATLTGRYADNYGRTGGKNGGVAENQLIAHTLRAEGFDASEDGTGRGSPLVVSAFSSKDDGGDAGELAPTLRAMGHTESHANGGGQVAVCFEPRFARNGRGAPSEVAPPLKAENGRTGKGDGAPCVASELCVRRLLPVEFERLQGFPDGHTAITYRGKLAKDGPRYRAIGNSMAVPVIAWIGRRIERYIGQALRTGVCEGDDTAPGGESAVEGKIGGSYNRLDRKGRLE